MQNFENRKIVFFGTPTFTVEFLELFKSLQMEIVAVVTGEDKPVGRGMQMRSSGPKVWATTLSKGAGLGVKILQPKKLDDDFYFEIKKIVDLENVDLFIVIAYGKIIPENIIHLPKFGTINLHYSLLPKYRGASPVETAILNSDKDTGITIQQMVYKLDAGNILFQENINILENETATELRNKLNSRALEIFPNFLSDFFAEKITQKTQDETQATACHKFTKDDFDVTNEMKEIQSKPENKNIVLEKIYLKFKAFDKKIYFFHSYNQKIMRVKITNMNIFEILNLLPENKKEISVQEFKNAFGEIF